MRTTTTLAVLAPLLIGVTPDTGLAQTLVDNANTQEPFYASAESSPASFTEFGPTILFSAKSDSLGREPWVVNDPIDGAQLVLDIAPGALGSNSGPFEPLGDGRWVFGATTPEFGSEPWITDGTPEGTRMIADLAPGPASSSPLRPSALNGIVYFVTSVSPSSQSQTTLWRTDGTEGGTFAIGVVEFDHDVEGTSVPDVAATNFGIFVSTGMSDLLRLWRSAGPLSPPELILEVEGSPSTASIDGPQSLTDLDGRLYFSLWQPGGSVLWSTDGTGAGTAPVPGVDGAESPISPDNFVTFEDHLYFVAWTIAGRQLWRITGDPSTLESVTTNDGEDPFSRVDSLTPITGPWGPLLAFTGERPSVGIELFISTGEPGEFQLLADLNEGPASSNPTILGETEGGLLVTSVVDGSYPPTRTWVVDGTESGTFPLYFDPEAPHIDITGDQYVVFTPWSEPGVEAEPWVSNGTQAGTFQLEDIATPFLDYGSDPDAIVALGSRAVYTRVSDGVGRELWSVAGTEVEPLGDYTIDNPQAVYGPIESPKLDTEGAEADGWGYLKADLAPSRRGLAISDGTPSGTAPFTDDPTSPAADEVRRVEGVLGNEAYFTRTVDGVHSLWRTDRASGEAVFLTDFGPASFGTTIANWTQYEGKAYFIGRTAATGRELWVTDGTSTGTTMVLDQAPGPDDGVYRIIASFGDRLVLQRFTGIGNLADTLLVSDGTANGTVPLLELAGDPLLDLGLQFAFGDALGEILVGSAGEHLLMKCVSEITVTPGSGPFEFDKEYDYALFSLASDFKTSTELLPYEEGTAAIFEAGDVAYTLLDLDEVGNQVLVRSDGKVGGTSVVKVLDPWSGYIGLPEAVDINSYTVTTDGRVVFVAADPAHGAELWCTDGTSDGTRRLTDIAPLGGSSAPTQILRAGSRIYFAADDGEVGRELHSIPLTDTGGWIAAIVGNGCPGALGTPQIDYSGEARLGESIDLQLTQAAPSSPVYLLFGLSGRPQLVLDCTVQVEDSQLLGPFVSSALGSLTLPFPIADDSKLAGASVWGQCLVLDPLAPSGFGALSPGLELVIGP